MTRTERHERRVHLRGWTVALAAIAAWLFLVSNSADAQPSPIPAAIAATATS